jgi:hypothetical protein
VQDAAEPIFVAVSIVAALAVVWGLRRIARIDAEGGRALALGMTGLMSAYPLTTITRSYGISVLQRGNAMAIHTRYAVIPSILAILLAWTILARPFRSVPWKVAACALLAWLSVSTVAVNPVYVPPHAFEPFAAEWPQQAAILQRALDKRRGGRLRGPVVVEQIWCRPRGEPFEPDFPPIPRVTVAP